MKDLGYEMLRINNTYYLVLLGIFQIVPRKLLGQIWSGFSEPQTRSKNPDRSEHLCIDFMKILFLPLYFQ